MINFFFNTLLLAVVTEISTLHAIFKCCVLCYIVIEIVFNFKQHTAESKLQNKECF